LFLNAGFNAGLILKTETKNRKLPFPVFDLKGIKVPSLRLQIPQKNKIPGLQEILSRKKRNSIRW
jgi:hypothetical protein